MKKVLITGASGYVGQFMLDTFATLSDEFEVLGTYSTRSLGCDNREKVMCKHLNVAEPNTFLPLLTEFVPDVVVNLAADSSPYSCEENPKRARAANIPIAFVEALLDANPDVVIVHFSTDQVYPGGTGPYDALNATQPRALNTYGRTKLEFEGALRTRCRSHYILRASMIYGPRTPRPCGKQSFVQFLEDKLFDGDDAEPLSLFADEYRSPVYVHDVVFATVSLAREQPALDEAHRTMNLGGPDTLSRAEIGALVARAAGRDPLLAVRRASRTETEGARYESPGDLTMDSTAVQRLVGVAFERMERVLPRVFALPNGEYPAGPAPVGRDGGDDDNGAGKTEL